LPYGRDISTITPESTALDYDAEDTLIVSEPEQLRALADELRGRIVGLLRERAWSTQQLARELEIPKGTIGHHLKVLERAGLIRVVHTRKVRAVTEKFYGRVARLFLFQAEDPADVRALGAATLRDAAALLERAPRGANWGLVLSRISKEDALRFARRLDKLVDDFREREKPDGIAHRLAVAYWPVEQVDDAYADDCKPDA
jgi:DNA-binding transcriptional ArsR family regulator